MLTKNRASFGFWLKQHRKVHDLTQEDLARRIGCSVVTVLKIEAGERKPSRQVAELLADCFDIPADERAAFVRFARSDLTDEQAESLAGLDSPSPWRRLHRQISHLPARLNSFIGREREMATAHSLLCRQGVRLLTFTGPPGVGKTRLSLEVASDLLDDFESGVYFVPLASISDPDLVASAIARTLGVNEAAGRSLSESLVEHLQDKRMLLLLDNFEHVLPAAPMLAELLSSAPWLKVLVTSRALMHVYGEHELRVPPLATPELAQLPTSHISEHEAISLFVERAQAVRPDFVLTFDNAPVIAQICRWLDGLPLAIELAAAHVRSLSPSTIQRHIGRRLDLLAGAAIDPLVQQQTLRNAIGWSYDLLDEEEQAVFRRLSVFSGGCTLEAGQAVGSDSEVVADRVPYILQSLVDKSLLSQGELESGESRFWMLETIREYARERLSESEEAATIELRHAEYYTRFAERAGLQLRGPGQVHWLKRLSNDHDNLRAALLWSEESHVDMALKLAVPLGLFWYQSCHWAEGRQRLASVLSRAESLGPIADRARVLNRLGAMAYRQDDDMLARLYLQESLDISRGLGQKEDVAFALVGLGALAIDEGNYSDARRYYVESLAISRDLGHAWLTSASLTNLGHVAKCEGDYANARLYLEESLAIDRRSEDERGMVLCFCGLGGIARREGDQSTARARYGEGLDISTQIGDKWGITICYEGLARVALDQGRHSEAQTYYQSSLAMSMELGNKHQMALCINGLAVILALQGQPEKAGRMFGATAKAYALLGSQMSLGEAQEYENNLAIVRARLDDVAFATAWGEGQLMTLEEAATCALEEVAQV